MRILALDSSGLVASVAVVERMEKRQVPSQNIRLIIRRHILRRYCLCWMRLRT